MNGLLQDVRYTLRQLRKSPGFTVVVVLILGLGIGGVVAMFGTLYAVMLRPLPYYEPGRLVLGRATYQGTINPWVSGPDYVDYRANSHSFSALEAFFFSPFEVTTKAGENAERSRGVVTTVGLFSVLGVKTELGRSFRADEGQDGAPPVVLVSHDYWQNSLHGRPDIVGQSIMVDGASNEIVGVLPRGFQFLQDVDVWLPLRPAALGPRRFNLWLTVGRLKDGVSLAEAQSDVDVIAAQLVKAYPDTNKGRALLLTPLQNAFAEKYRTGLGLLLAGAAATLLVAWANAAGLLLARGAGRQGELAVRLALGAPKRRLIGLLVIEGLLLAGAGGAAGCILAAWIQKSLLRLMPIEAQLLGGVGLSLPLLLSIVAATLFCGAGFGLLPMGRANRGDLGQAVRSSGRGTVGRGVRFRRGLVAAQIAISLVLLIVAGLLLRSLTSLRRSDPGFDTRNLLTAEIPLPARQQSDQQRAAFFDSFLERVNGLPGVVSAGIISQLPLRNPYNDVGIYPADAPPASPGDEPSGYQRVVLPGYFRTMRIPILAGRDIQPSDTFDSRRVVVISRRMATRLFGDRDPLGRAVIIDRANDTTWAVVGVVGDVKQSDPREADDSFGSFYRPYSQLSVPTMRLVVRTEGNPLAMVDPLGKLLYQMNPEVPLSGPRTMQEVVANLTISEKAQAACLAGFSAVAVILAMVGIYGLLAYVVVHRQAEFGLRLAMGAQHSDLLKALLRDGLITSVAGIAAGLVAAAIGGRLMASALYGVQPLDPLSFLLAGGFMICVSLAACYLPARRAMRVDPMTALRCE